MKNPIIKKLTEENIADEHICCAISDKKCIEGYKAKKDWLKDQFKDGYVFKKLSVRGKVFIEYVPSENGWLPIKAPGYMLVNCFWVSGKYKKNGHGSQLLQECINDAVSQNKEGIVVVVGKNKKPFMSDRIFFQKNGFLCCDTALPFFELWYLPFKISSMIPQFKSCAIQGKCDIPDGLSVYYTNACPFTEFYVNTELVHIAKNRNISLSINKLDTIKKAQNHFVPHTIYSAFYNGNFVTQHILNQKNFDKFVPIA